MNNMLIRIKLMEKGMRYYELDRILGISEPTRCRMFRSELPIEKQNEIVRKIEEACNNGADK